LKKQQKDLLSNRKFVNLRTIVVAGNITKSEKLYHESNLAQRELKLIKMIKDFGPSTYIALLATSNDKRARSQFDEIVNGRVTSDLFKSDCPPRLWDDNIKILEEYVEELKTRQDKIAKLEQEISQA